MQTRHVSIGVASIVFATVLTLSLSFPVAAAEKVAGINQGLPESFADQCECPGPAGSHAQADCSGVEETQILAKHGPAPLRSRTPSGPTVRNAATQPIICKTAMLIMSAGKALLRPQ